MSPRDPHSRKCALRVGAPAPRPLMGVGFVRGVGPRTHALSVRVGHVWERGPICTACATRVPSALHGGGSECAVATTLDSDVLTLVPLCLMSLPILVRSAPQVALPGGTYGWVSSAAGSAQGVSALAGPRMYVHRGPLATGT